MAKYILKRLIMMIPTIIGITILSFIVINLAPGGPIERKIQQIRFGAQESGGGSVGDPSQVGISEDTIRALEQQYGFDKPLLVRYGIWLKNIATLNFGDSFTYEEPVWDLILSKFPVSLQFGIVSIILTYLICIPLGVWKAVRDGSRWDGLSSFFLFVLYSVPPVMLGILARTFLAGESYLGWFPIHGLQSDDFESLSLWGKIFDRAHHFVLPLMCYMVNSFTVLTFLMKNSLLEEIKLDYVRTARAKGLDEKAVVFKHALRNALIPLVTGLGSFLGVFLAGSLIIERLFDLDGIGLLGFQSALDRDYNVLMALIFVSSLVSLLGRLISDLLYTVVDPRIDFN